MEKKSKIIIMIIIIAIIAVFVGGIIIFNNKSTETSTKNSTKKNLTAEEIVNILKEKVAYIGEYVVYTEETDLNNLLGRPNQYISKITFEDTRLEQVNKDNEFLTEEERKEPIGGTIEVFSNTKDLENRKKYIETLSSSASIFNQYIYSSGNALFRLEKDLTPSQAQEYENVFYEIMKKGY